MSLILVDDGVHTGTSGNTFVVKELLIPFFKRQMHELRPADEIHLKQLQDLRDAGIPPLRMFPNDQYDTKLIIGE